ncbi:MAG TPA: hypothetical protein PK280_04310 [Planctomycetota bacterium]|nr:hypothetical protein [Planctomycetota bacterium]
MDAEPERPGGFRIPAEAWAAVVIVTVCFGAYFGPLLWRRAQLNREIRELFAAKEPREIGWRLRGLNWRQQPAADSAIGRFAAEAPERLWLPEERTFLWLIDDRSLMLVAPQLEEGYEIRELPEEMTIENLSGDGREVAITFSLGDALATRMGVARGAKRRAHVPLKVLLLSRKEEHRLFQRTMAPEVIITCTNADFFADNWLRMAGEAPRARKEQS